MSTNPHDKSRASAAGGKRKPRARRWVPAEPRPPLDHKEARRLYEKEGRASPGS